MPYIAALAFVVLFFAAYKGGLERYAKQLLVCLVDMAEQSYGSGTGKLKYSAVAAKLYDMMPKIFKFIFSERAIAAMIEQAVADMKKSIGKSEVTLDSEEGAHE